VRIALLLGLALLAASAWAEKPAQETTIRGQVIPSKPVAQHVDETVKMIGEDGKTYELVVEADNYHTLHDPALADRLWEIVGYPGEAARFDVRHLYTIVDGVRRKVQYYCEICHIVSYRPGPCMCCQKEVELQELVDEPKP
jgi:hypothetical protein